MGEISNKISLVRSEVEECFYTLSADLEREEAEKCAIPMYKKGLEDQLQIHERYIETSKDVMKSQEKQKKRGWFEDNTWSEGAITAHEGRIKTHKEEIKLIKEKLELVDFL
jgi:hypothetical protein